MLTWWNNRGIRTKLLTFFLVLGLIPLVGVGLVAYRSAERTVVVAAGLRVEDTAFNAIDKLDRNLFERYGDVQAFSMSAPARSMDPARLSEWIDAMMGVYTPIYSLMVVADTQGRIVAVNSVDLDGKPLPASQRLLGHDVSGEPWFRAAIGGQIKDGASFVDDLHTDTLLRTVYGTVGGADIALGFTAPIKDEHGRIIGVWTNRFNWTVATQALDDVLSRAHANGMATMQLELARADGVVLIGPANRQVLEDSLAAHPGYIGAKSRKTGHTDGVERSGSAARLVGWASSTGYSTYSGLGWVLVASQDADEVLAPATELGLTLALTAVLAVAGLTAGSWLAARGLLRRINRLGYVAHQLALGDLRQAVVADSADELGQMARAMSDVIHYQREVAALANAVAHGDLTQEIASKSDHDSLSLAVQAMVANLRSLLSDLTLTAEGIADTSAQLGHTALRTSDVVHLVTRSIQHVANGAEETSQAARGSHDAVGQLSQAIDSVARGAQEQAHQVQQASGASSSMASDVTSMAGNVNAVAAASERTRSSARHGADAVQQTVTGMEQIKLVVLDARAKVEDLGRLSERIGDVVETIDDIAEQTNLLALNAAIEAARAGDAGRGFAVVADEVRKLAERSQRETRAIGDLIRAVQVGTQDAVSAMAAGSLEVDQGITRAVQAGAALDEITAAIEATVDQVSGIATVAQAMAQGSRTVTATMESIAEVVEENSAATEQMAAQAGEVVGLMTGITSISEQNSSEARVVMGSAVDMSARVEEMNAQAEAMTDAAQRLRSLVDRFRLTAGSEAATASGGASSVVDWESMYEVTRSRAS